MIVSRTFQVTRPLTKQLQASDMDAVKSVSKIYLLPSMVNKLHSEIDQYHESWYQEAASLVDVVGTTPSKPRTIPRQTGRSNFPADKG